MNHGAQKQSIDSSRGLAHAWLRETCHPGTSYRFPFRPSGPGLVNEKSARETDSENPTFQNTPSHPTS